MQQGSTKRQIPNLTTSCIAFYYTNYLCEIHPQKIEGFKVLGSILNPDLHLVRLTLTLTNIRVHINF